jgi:hypothetical protein
MTRVIWSALVLAVAVIPAASQQGVRIPVGAPQDGWVVDRADLAGNVKFEPLLGRTDAMLLRSNTHVVKSGLDFGDGTIEFDLAPLAEGDFAALTFRRQSFANHENVYLRLSRSGEFMAMQYAPRVNGSSTWQLYPEFTAATDWPRNTWTHIRVDVHGSQLEAFAGDGKAPVLTVPRLRNGTTRGEIGFWARVNDKPAEWAAAISNLKITEATAQPLTPPVNAPVEFVWNWQISNPLPLAGRVLSMPASIESWTAVRSEESGLINVNRLFSVQKTRSTVFAKHVFTSDAARRVVAGIGYSDDVTVFVNGEPIYFGINGWESRSPGFASFVDARFESAVLPFRQGQNEVVLAVSDDQRFGWGFAMRIQDATGLKF